MQTDAGSRRPTSLGCQGGGKNGRCMHPTQHWRPLPERRFKAASAARIAWKMLILSKGVGGHAAAHGSTSWRGGWLGEP